MLIKNKKPRKKKYKSPLKRRREKCDELFSKYIKERDQKCQNEFCKGRSDILDWSHYISRSRLSTRWDERNSYALCRSCHMYFDGNALGGLEYDEFVCGRLGSDTYFALKDKARTIVKERKAVEECEAFLKEKGYL